MLILMLILSLLPKSKHLKKKERKKKKKISGPNGLALSAGGLGLENISFVYILKAHPPQQVQPTQGGTLHTMSMPHSFFTSSCVFGIAVLIAAICSHWLTSSDVSKKCLLNMDIMEQEITSKLYALFTIIICFIISFSIIL